MSESTQVALEYHKALRAEIVERLKMRDGILLGYIAAASALVGYSLEHLHDISPLVFILPFLALGSAITIAQHQDQIVAFNQYLTRELAEHLPAGAEKVITFNESDASRQNLAHNLWMNLTGQLILLCGPPIFIVFANWPYFTNGWSLKESYALVGIFLTALTVSRLWMSRNFRNHAMQGLLHPIRKNATQHHP